MTIHNKMMDDRRTPEEIPVKDFLNGKKRFHDKEKNIDIVKIFSGDWYVATRSGIMLSTILGSCVSACIRDPVLGIGGMNHFLLPGDNQIDSQVSDAARYGVFAMERLINGILSQNGQKHRLEIKIFGGGNVTNNSARIGSQNAAFIRNYLNKEGFRIASEDLEGNFPRCVHYYPDTGTVMMRLLKRKEDLIVVKEEMKYSKEINQKPIDGDIELFE